jgi:hypothetical protein
MSPVKLKKALAVAVAALQVPLLMLWKITYDALSMASQAIEQGEDGGYTAVFKADLFGSALLRYSPAILALLACVVLSIVGLVVVFKGKGSMNPATICVYGVTVIACGVLILVFSCPNPNPVHSLRLSEFMFFRYFMGMELNITAIFPLLQAIKYFLLGLCAAGSGILCGLGIADLSGRRKAPPMDGVSVIELYEIQGRREK